jgi:hypothetical protein
MERLYIYIMKKILLILICLLFARMANAQDNQLALDEHNKYIYYQVIDLPGVSADSLNKNAAGFIKMTYNRGGKVSKGNTDNISVKDKFLTQNATAFVKHENGEINYVLNIECKDAKYRFWLTDFVFTPYERDRYGAFVPAKGINLPIETASSKIDKKELSGYLDQTNTFCKQLGERLKQYMAGQRPEIKKTDRPPVKKIVTDKW